MLFVFVFADIFRTQSAFYRPTPASKLRFHHTTTPYSDALKAAAILPHHPTSLNILDSPTYSLNNDPLSTFRNDLRASPLIGPIPPPPYWLASFPPPYRLPGSVINSSAPLYPIIYRPKILTQNVEDANSQSSATPTIINEITASSSDRNSV